MRALRSPILLVACLASCGQRLVPSSVDEPSVPSVPSVPSSAKAAGAPATASSASAQLPPGCAAEPAPPVEPSVVALAAEATSPVAEPELEQEPSIVLAAGGDVNFGRECGQAILKDVAYDPFAGLNEAWKSADARFVNLESQLSDQHGLTQSPSHRLIFTGPPGGADVLAQARVSLVSTANNHAWDYGKSALLETIENLERAQVQFAGTGRDAEQAYRPAVLQVSGRSIALFAVTQVWNQPPFATSAGKDYVAWANVDKLKAGIEQARREHDFVIVSYHGGEEYVDAPIERTRAFAKAVMALGVDVFIGHHPHVPQGVGWVDGRPIVYSLGNFVFAGHDERPWTKQSFFARITLKKGAPAELSACPYAIDGHRPRAFHQTRETLATERFRLHLIGISVTVGGSNVAPADQLGCLRVTEKPARQPSLSSSN